MWQGILQLLRSIYSSSTRAQYLKNVDLSVQKEIMESINVSAAPKNLYLPQYEQKYLDFLVRSRELTPSLSLSRTHMRMSRHVQSHESARVTLTNFKLVPRTLANVIHVRHLSLKCARLVIVRQFVVKFWNKGECLDGHALRNHEKTNSRNSCRSQFRLQFFFQVRSRSLLMHLSICNLNICVIKNYAS